MPPPASQTVAIAAAAAPPFAGALERFGDRVAVVARGRPVAYGELAERADARARELGPGRRLVLVRGGNDVETLVTYLAALRAGHVAWLAAPGAPARDAAVVGRFRPDTVVSVDDGRVDIATGGAEPGHELHPELALLMPTSGSTGAPRLVRISHAALHANAEAIATYLAITERDRAATSLPMHYCYGLSVVNSHLLRGGRLLLTDRSVADPAFWALVREGGATSFAGVPHTFDLLERVGFAGMDLPSLRYVTQAGGRLAPERVRRYARLGRQRGWELVVMYGQTEATARMAYLPPALAEARPSAIGVPVPGGSLRLADVPEADEPGVGELVYRGPNVMLGYAREAADLALGRVVDELRTGDLARRGPDGLLEIVGRRSRFLKLFGLRIDLDEVERMLAADGLAAACTGDDERLVVAVAGDGPRACLGPSLAGRLGVPASRVAVVAVERIPRGPSGKTDYPALAALAPPPAAAPEGVAAAAGADAGAATGRVAAILAAAVGRDRVGADDSFAALGGDSLSYVEVSIALEEELGHLPPDWPRRTVAELAAGARERGRGARLETSVALRAAAILLVVASHMTAFWPAGGAHLLLGLAGHSFARFQLAAMDAPRRLARSAAAIARVAVPASAWIWLQVLVAGSYSAGAAMLVNNYTGSQELGPDGRWHYWFLEALVQTLIVLTALFAIPAVRRWERRRPFAVVLVLLAGALLFRFELLAFGAGDNLMFRPHAVAWVFLLGWAVHRATTTGRRAAVSALVVATVPGFFGVPAQEAVVTCGLLVLLWAPAVRVPRWMVRPAGAVAAASLFIYLTHWQVFPPLARELPLAVAMPLTVAVGVAAWRLAGLACAACARVPARPGRARGESPALALADEPG
ncbi:AMP-binding protein [Miltoncostaea marina]|uniref:AMP-binding protein n=1 Tax=Miltoncostaea marina TaxID=2843215 RepID=UPI001C3C8F7A|nr:AMP-binding protein [Miltoncostaea marina]